MKLLSSDDISIDKLATPTAGICIHIDKVAIGSDKK